MQPAPGPPGGEHQAPKPARTGPAGPPQRPASPGHHQPPGPLLPGRSSTPGSAAWTRPAAQPAARASRAGACCPAPAAPGPRTGAVTGSASPRPARRSPARLRHHPDAPPSGMAYRLGRASGVRRVHAQGRLAQVHRDALGDARRDQQHLPLAVRTRQHALHRVGCRREVNRRDLAVLERLPPDPDRDLQEILPLQPDPVRDQQLSSRLGGQPALRPRPDRLSEVIEARSKAGSPSRRSRTRS